jgi:hypothetical protein
LFEIVEFKWNMEEMDEISEDLLEEIDKHKTSNQIKSLGFRVMLVLSMNENCNDGRASTFLSSATNFLSSIPRTASKSSYSSTSTNHDPINQIQSFFSEEELNQFEISKSSKEKNGRGNKHDQKSGGENAIELFCYLGMTRDSLRTTVVEFLCNHFASFLSVEQNFHYSFVSLLHFRASLLALVQISQM